MNKVRFRDWAFKDQVLLVLASVGFLIAASLGAGNVYANLMSSGNPVFIEAPWLAFALSMLLPIGSMSIKYATQFFEFDHTRRWFALFIYMLTLVVLLIWSVLFAQNFPGVSGGIGLSAMLDSGSSGPWLVWAQLAAELLAGSALFLGAESIYLKYSPTYYVENIHYLDLEKRLKAHREEMDVLTDQRGEAMGRLETVRAQRQVEINYRVAEFLALCQRHAAANH